MYEIRPSSAEPAFLERGTLFFDPGFHRQVDDKESKIRTVITDRHLFMGNDAYGVIWDFVKRRYRFWFVLGRDSSEQVEVNHSHFASGFLFAFSVNQTIY